MRIMLVLLSAFFVHGERYDPLSKRVPGKVNVHVVAHTHDDVGWLKTVDQYYACLNQSIQMTCVRHLIDQFVRGLPMNPERTYNYVEQAFFQRWWGEQSETKRNIVRQAVANGQLKFLNGGWCMHDEATPHYIDMIDQTTLGHRFIVDEFGLSAMPTMGWQIDPFGHSATQASLMSSLIGFDGLFFARIDYQDRAYRAARRNLETMWKASPSIGAKSSVFAGAFLANGYGPPSGFDYDVYSEDTPVQSDPQLHDYNVPARVQAFVDQVATYTDVGVGNDVLALFGSDFQWTAGLNYFDKIENLMMAVNADGRLNMFWSHPEAYVKAKAAYNHTWSVKTDDYFPYADRVDSYWTGYFSSRPALKQYIRYMSHLYTAGRQIARMAGDMVPLDTLGQAMGVAQHHDAVSGTEKQHVAFDYAERLAHGALTDMPRVMRGAARMSNARSLEYCPLMNVSICAPSMAAQSGFTFVAWNSVSRSRRATVRIPVSHCADKVTIKSSSGSIDEVDCIRAQQSYSNYKPVDGAPFELVAALDLPPTGWRTFSVDNPPVSSDAIRDATAQAANLPPLANSDVRVDMTSSGDFRITNLRTGAAVPVGMSWSYYTGAYDLNQNSGAYIFRPYNEGSRTACGEVLCPVGPVPAVTVVKNKAGAPRAYDLVYESWLSVRMSLPVTGPYVEVQYTVGPIPYYGFAGKEVVVSFNTDLATNSSWYTDSNGREMELRRKNFRFSWPYSINQPVSGNFVPVDVAIAVKDVDVPHPRQFTVLTDTSQSGASLSDGQIQLMAHRRLLVDDGRGVGEPLNETETVLPYVGPFGGERLGPALIKRGRYRLFADFADRAAASWRPGADDLYADPLLMFSAGSPAARGEGSLISQALPANVLLTTVEAVSPTETIVRFGHQFAIGEDPILSKPATVNIDKVLSSLNYNRLEEKTVTAQFPVSRLRERVQFRTEEGLQPNNILPDAEYKVGPSVSISASAHSS